MNLIKELDAEKKAVLIRLRHMEAYCHNPSPPSTLKSSTSSCQSLDEQPRYPERRVTEKDYHNLAQQYRERDAMESLHRSKIEVLRGRQDKSYEAFAERKKKDLAELEAANEKSLHAADWRHQKDEEVLVDALNKRGMRLQKRWRLQELIERTKLEKNTGKRYALLHVVVVGQDASSSRSGVPEESRTDLQCFSELAV